MAAVIESLAMLWPALVLAVTAHEAAHALVATLFGDHLARDTGRLSINPLRHCSWLGTALVPCAAFTLSTLAHLPGALVGWGRAVPFGSPLAGSRLGLLCTALAGPLANLLLASACLALRPLAGPGAWLAFLDTSASLNVLLVVVNLLPVRPLDGATCIQALCAQRWRLRHESLQPYLQVLVAGLLFTGLLGQYLRWAARTLLSLLPGNILHG